ncbi:3-demethylubiquinone-9 3-O-methyltransferase [Rhodococcus zopfii]|uniref:3-demethylubiquinone-9 3-O-methyltransferase n=1 Tax=Rhodococcus zopfii TaxID=43772 RepID=A0ABU3WN56_9NOCA|nr:3-demethylubiquinone-9 3-O-methyltransferase [Rhodococcus zopfii]
MTLVAIDNHVYDRIGEGWWDESNPLNLLQGSLTPARYGYFRDVLRERGFATLDGLRALDIGSGGGFLAERFARAGCDVVGIDPSTVSLDTAHRHAAASGLSIDYRRGVGERLPVGDSTFDLAYCCDVLEHVDDLDAVLAETARALTPGGLYFFDTINRTWLGRLVVIKIMQEWRWTRMFDTPVHDWSMFITPAELTAALDRHGLRLTGLTGLGLRTADPRRLIDMHRARQGRLTYGEVSRRLNFGRVPYTGANYMGYAVKTAARG